MKDRKSIQDITLRSFNTVHLNGWIMPFPFLCSRTAFVPLHRKSVAVRHAGTIISWTEENGLLSAGCMTHQYGVPMKESLLCNVLVFLADTPKSAEGRRNDL